MTDEKAPEPEPPRERLYRLHDEMCKAAKAIMRKKNADYAREGDPFHNFRRHGLKGFVVRMDDKMCRLDNYVEKGTFEVADESIEDTLADLINYAVLFRGWLEEKKVK